MLCTLALFDSPVHVKNKVTIHSSIRVRRLDILTAAFMMVDGLTKHVLLSEKG